MRSSILSLASPGGTHARKALTLLLIALAILTYGLRADRGPAGQDNGEPACSETADAAGKSINPERLFPFHDGRKWGYINCQGEVVIPPRFQWACDFKEGRARVVDGARSGYIDVQGDLVFTVPDAWGEVDWTRPFAEGLAAFSAKGKCGYFDRQGRVVVAPGFDDAQEFSEGLAAVNVGAVSAGRPDPLRKKGGQWGFIDRTGRLVIPVQFSYVDAKGFVDGLACVQTEREKGYIDKTGAFALTLKADTAEGVWWSYGFSEGLALVYAHRDSITDNYVGFIDRTGRAVIEPRFHSAQDFSEGLAAVAVGVKWGYVDRQGRMAIPPQFKEAHDFSEGLALVLKGKHWCYVDRRGKTLITGPFNDAEGFYGGLARVHEGGSFRKVYDGPSYWSGGTWFYINRKGEKVWRYGDDEVKGAQEDGGER